MLKRISLFMLLILLTWPFLTGQKIQFGIQFTPLELSSLTFDQKYIIFDDYTSYKLNINGLHLAIPSLSNSGFFVRYPMKNLALQSGIEFQNNLYFYSVNELYLSTIRSFYYSSIDIPLTLSYTLSGDARLKLRLLAGGNFKSFKISRNFYSVFAKSIDVFFSQEDTEIERNRRQYLVSKVSPFMLCSRIGAGLSYYNFTMDLCADKNLTDMNRKIDPYNANFKDSFQLTLVLGIRLTGKDLKPGKREDKITRE